MSRIVKDLPPIIVDTREQSPFCFDRYKRQYGIKVKTDTLHTGDYSLENCENIFAVERKSGPDLVGSMSSGRQRFEREMTRGMALKQFFVVVEVGYEYIFEHQYRTQMDPHSLLQSIVAWQARGVPIILAGSRPKAAYVTFWLLEKCFRELRAREEKQECLIS